MTRFLTALAAILGLNLAACGGNVNVDGTGGGGGGDASVGPLCEENWDTHQMGQYICNAIWEPKLAITSRAEGKPRTCFPLITLRVKGVCLP